MKSKIHVKPIKYATKKSIVKARRLPFLIFGFLDQSLPACNTSQNWLVPNVFRSSFMTCLIITLYNIPLIFASIVAGKDAKITVKGNNFKNCSKFISACHIQMQNTAWHGLMKFHNCTDKSGGFRNEPSAPFLSEAVRRGFVWSQG